MHLMWELMLQKTSYYHQMRDPNLISRHPTMLPSYRTILFSWLSQLSQEYKLHRETYYLACDYFDRYLSTQTNIHKLQLQLIGTTCIFIASKFEEIRPPSVYEFADLTDGACTANDILTQELIILGAIKWEITPMTANSWLSTYLQLHSSPDKENHRCPTTRRATIAAQQQQHPHPQRHTQLPLIPNYEMLNNNQQTYKMIVCLIDLALLDINSLRYDNSKLAAAALYHFTNETTLTQCTGYKFKDIRECIQWLRPFAQIVGENFHAQCQEELEPLANTTSPTITTTTTIDDHGDKPKEPIESNNQQILSTDDNEPNCTQETSSKHPSHNNDQRDHQQEDTDSAKSGSNTIQVHQHIADEVMLKMVHDRIEEIQLQKQQQQFTATQLLGDSSPEKPTSLLTPPRSCRKRKRSFYEDNQPSNVGHVAKK